MLTQWILLMTAELKKKQLFARPKVFQSRGGLRNHRREAVRGGESLREPAWLLSVFGRSQRRPEGTGLRHRPAGQHGPQADGWERRRARPLRSRAFNFPADSPFVVSFASSQTPAFRATSWPPWSPVNTVPLRRCPAVCSRSARSWRSSPFASAAWSTTTSWSSPPSTKRSSRKSSQELRSPKALASRGGSGSGLWLCSFPLQVMATI